MFSRSAANKKWCLCCKRVKGGIKDGGICVFMFRLAKVSAHTEAGRIQQKHTKLINPCWEFGNESVACSMLLMLLPLPLYDFWNMYWRIRRRYRTSLLFCETTHIHIHPAISFVSWMKASCLPSIHILSLGSFVVWHEVLVYLHDVAVAVTVVASLVAWFDDKLPLNWKICILFWRLSYVCCVALTFGLNIFSFKFTPSIPSFCSTWFCSFLFHLPSRIYNNNKNPFYTMFAKNLLFVCGLFYKKPRTIRYVFVHPILTHLSYLVYWQGRRCLEGP